MASKSRVKGSLNRTEHKEPMDVEFLARMADLRCQINGTSSTSSTPRESLAFLGSSASTASSNFSESFSVTSLPPVVQFPPTPVFTDQIPAEITRKLELLTVTQTPNAPASASQNAYPLHPVITTRSLDTAHEDSEDSDSTISSGYNSSLRQQPPKLSPPTRSVPQYTTSRQTRKPTKALRNSYPLQNSHPVSLDTTNEASSSSITSSGHNPTPRQQIMKRSVTSASTATPRTASRTTNPLPTLARPSNHSPPPMTQLENQHRPPPPPNKANLKAWWNQFVLANPLKDNAVRGPRRALDTADHPIFGKPLLESLRHAKSQISTANANGKLYVWGYIPVVIAKCGLYLKENATEVPGTFTVSGSTRRMRDLQLAFETPPRYGESLDWRKEPYTTHDIATVFQRYLSQMPKPVIPHDMYHSFRKPLAKKVSRVRVIAAYKSLVCRMYPENQYLLLYILDLLSAFSKKCEKNLMTVTLLASVFRPSLLSHPQHEMSPDEHALNERVVEFLIDQHDWFMADISPLAERP